MIYAACVATGIVLASYAVRFTPQDSRVSAAQRARILWAAAAGAIAGAYLLQLPADHLGWTVALGDQDVLPLGGRTVLGGLLGGWWAVEIVKRWIGVRVPTGDRFALPLAVSLAFGRIGCTFAGCCGAPLVPVIEAYFHALVAVWCLLAQWRGWYPGARLAAYLTLYAALRFALEYARPNPVVFASLTYYQWLCLPLLVTAGVTWYRRRRALTRV